MELGPFCSAKMRREWCQGAQPALWALGCCRLRGCSAPQQPELLFSPLHTPSVACPHAVPSSPCCPFVPMLSPCLLAVHQDPEGRSAPGFGSGWSRAAGLPHITTLLFLSPKALYTDPDSCRGRCEEPYSHEDECHCDADCRSRNSCCWDYLEHCGEGEHGWVGSTQQWGAEG